LDEEDLEDFDKQHEDHEPEPEDQA
jgi:hypothetical protein